jgi:hypothetical protein
MGALRALLRRKNGSSQKGLPFLAFGKQNLTRSAAKARKTNLIKVGKIFKLRERYQSLVLISGIVETIFLSRHL